MVAERARKEKGLEEPMWWLVRAWKGGLELRKAYFRRKWGIRYRPGKSTKAGKVMRLKMPKDTREPSRAEERSEDRCWNSASLAGGGGPVRKR